MTATVKRNKKVVSVAMSPDLAEALKVAAELAGSSVSDLVEQTMSMRLRELDRLFEVSRFGRRIARVRIVRGNPAAVSAAVEIPSDAQLTGTVRAHFRGSIDLANLESALRNAARRSSRPEVRQWSEEHGIRVEVLHVSEQQGQDRRFIPGLLEFAADHVLRAESLLLADQGAQHCPTCGRERSIEVCSTVGLKRPERGAE